MTNISEVMIFIGTVSHRGFFLVTCRVKVKNSDEIHDGLDAAIGEGLTWLGHSTRGILYLCQLPATLLRVNNFESSTVRSVGVTSSSCL